MLCSLNVFYLYQLLRTADTSKRPSHYVAHPRGAVVGAAIEPQRILAANKSIVTPFSRLDFHCINEPQKR